MKRATLLAATVLLICAGCRPRPTGPGIYGPWEEGLTLAFEDPSQPTPEMRTASHVQLRVSKGLMDPARPGEIRLTENTLHGSLSYAMHYEEGGKALLNEAGKVEVWILPKGFPGRAQTWVDTPRGLSSRVIGRAVWPGASILPSTADPTGVWVEVERQDGLKRRGLFLQDLGEVETLEWRNGRWVAIHRLVSRGFTDLPSSSAR